MQSGESFYFKKLEPSLQFASKQEAQQHQYAGLCGQTQVCDLGNDTT